MSRPITLTIAVILNWIAAAIFLIAGLIMLLGAGTATLSVSGDLERLLKEEGIPTEVLRVGLFGFGIFMLVLAVVTAIVALSLARGHAWARIVLTVFAILGIVSAVLELFNPSMLWRGILGIIVNGVVLWFMWNAASSAYIKAKAAERAIGG